MTYFISFVLGCMVVTALIVVATVTTATIQLLIKAHKDPK